MFTSSLIRLLMTGAVFTGNAFARPPLPNTLISSEAPSEDPTDFIKKRDGQQIQSPMDDCAGLDFAEEWSGGRSSGTPFCASQIKNGHIIKGFFFWNSKINDPIHMNGMTVLYENGDYSNIGTLEGTRRWMEWDTKTVSVKSVDLIPRDLSWEGTLNHVRIITTQDNKLYGGCEGPGCYPQHVNWKDHGQTPIHGTIVGVAGKTGQWGIESLTFYTLNSNAKSIFLHDIVFSPTLEELNLRQGNDARGMKEESTVVGHYVNLGHEGDPDIVGHLKKTFTHEDGHEVTVSDTQLAHVGIGFEAELEEGVPFAKTTLTGKFEAWWEGSWTHTDKRTTKDTNSVEMSIDVTAKPQQAAKVVAYFVRGELDRTWSGKETITFENGKNLTIPVSGKLKESKYSEGWFNIEYETLGEALQAIEGGEAVLNENGDAISQEDKNALVGKIKEQV